MMTVLRAGGAPASRHVSLTLVRCGTAGGGTKAGVLQTAPTVTAKGPSATHKSGLLERRQFARPWGVIPAEGRRILPTAESRDPGLGPWMHSLTAPRPSPSPTVRRC